MTRRSFTSKSQTHPRSFRTNHFSCAISHALETTDASDIPLELKKYEVPSTANPYVLPWIMRGLLEEEFVKNELNSETHELLKQFDDWLVPIRNKYV
jgi:hypothetical protein